MPNVQRPQIHAETPASAQLPFIYGRYQLSPSRIPYFSTTMSLRDANDFLKLVNEFPGAETVQWRIEELFQRDVNWPRVEQKIVPYLRNPANPQFFNSLTIALLPIQGGQIRPAFGGDGWLAPQLIGSPGEFPKTLTCGPISVGYYGEWASVSDPGARLGQLRWNPDQVFSVALDGQHRLASIKAYLQGVPAERQNLTQIPVLLIILDPKVGYELAPAHSATSTVEVLRRLFIDLNKHAVNVARSRIILLDDTDPLSLCLRRTLGEKISNGLDELGATPPRLPLSLINWHEEKEAKFDEGPYVTSILALDWVLKKVLRIEPIEDFTDYDRIERELGLLSKSLGLNLVESGSPTLQRLRGCDRTGLAFSFTQDELLQITNAFSRVCVPPVLHVLTRFRPYADLVQTRDDNDSLTVEFINWYYLKVQADGAGGGQAQQNFNQFIHRVQNRPENPIAGHVFDDALQEVEQLKGDSLAFKVVFQRSLFLALLEFSKITDEHIQQLDGDGADASEDILDDQGAEDSGDEGEQLDEIGVLAALTRVRAEVFVNALNSLTNAAPDFLELRCEIDSGSVRHLLWNGTLYDPAGGTIDFTGAAASRGLELMVWTAILHLLDAEEHSSVQGSFEEFWDFLSGDELPPVHRRLRNSRRRFVEGAAIRILRASRPDFDDLTDDERNEAAHEECKTRFRWVWQRVVEI